MSLHVNYLLFLTDFNETWIFRTDFRKNPQIKNFMKSVRWEPRCFSRGKTDRQTDGRTEMTKLAAASFRNFANVPKTVPETRPRV